MFRFQRARPRRLKQQLLYLHDNATVYRYRHRNLLPFQLLFLYLVASNMVQTNAAHLPLLFIHGLGDWFVLLLIVGGEP